MGRNKNRLLNLGLFSTLEAYKDINKLGRQACATMSEIGPTDLVYQGHARKSHGRDFVL